MVDGAGGHLACISSFIYSFFGRYLIGLCIYSNNDLMHDLKVLKKLKCHVSDNINQD